MWKCCIYSETHTKQHLRSNQVHILYSMEYNKPLALVNTTDTFQLVSQNTTSIRLHFIKTPGRLSDDTCTHSYQHIFTAQWQIMQSTITPSPSYCVHHLSIIQVQDGATYCGILLLCLQLWSGEDLALCCCVYICDVEKTRLNHKWHHSKWVSTMILANPTLPAFLNFRVNIKWQNGKQAAFTLFWSQLAKHAQE